MNRAEKLAKGIYWDRSWSPFTGCTPVGEGCENCWARRTAEGRLRGRCGYPADDPFRPIFHPDRLSQVNSKQKPQVIALCFMSDPFHERHHIQDIHQMLDKIIECPQHTFIALTKREGRMHAILGRDEIPIPNLVGGVSIWDQESADGMIPILLQTNLSTRIVSLEPALGAVDLRGYLHPCFTEFRERSTPITHYEKIDGVILGGESGPGARPMHPDIPRSVRDQCQAANVPFFFKQWGEYRELDHEKDIHESRKNPEYGECPYEIIEVDGIPKPYPTSSGTGYITERAAMVRVGKKAAGRLLDGRTWDELPEIMTRKAG